MLTPLNPFPPRARLRSEPSRPELAPVMVDGTGYILDALTMDVYRATPALMAAISVAPPEVIGLRPSPVFPAPGNEWPPCGHLVLNVTHACNLRCRYCFVREQQAAGELSSAYMSRDRAMDAIAALDPTGIGFFGGEPLLNWDVVVAATLAFRDRKPGGHCHITTNGTLMTGEKASWLKDVGGFSLIVSVDGDPERHNRLRPMASGKDSYAATREGMAHLAVAGFRPTLRSTFTNDGCDLVAELEHLNQLCDDGLGGHVSIEPVSLTEGCTFGEQAITPSIMRGFEPMYMDAADWFIARARAGKRARFHHIGKMLERLLHKIPQPSECGAGKRYLTVTPEGGIHACHREKSLIGHILDSQAKFTPAREEWRDNRLDVHNGCPSCAYRYLCGGGCRLNHFETSGDTRTPDPSGCVLTEIRVKMAIKVLDALGPRLAAEVAGIPLGKPQRRDRHHAKPELAGTGGGRTTGTAATDPTVA